MLILHASQMDICDGNSPLTESSTIKIKESKGIEYLTLDLKLKLYMYKYYILKDYDCQVVMKLF